MAASALVVKVHPSRSLHFRVRLHIQESLRSCQLTAWRSGVDAALEEGGGGTKVAVNVTLREMVGVMVMLGLRLLLSVGVWVEEGHMELVWVPEKERSGVRVPQAQGLLVCE